MSKIATKAYCNIVEAGSMNSGTFLTDLIKCPTYQKIIEVDKFNVTGTYENNQLVKESDISKYTGKTKNYGNIWGEYELSTNNDFISAVGLYLKFHITFLYTPDVPVNITINYTIRYKAKSSSTYLTSKNGTTTIKIENPNLLDGVYGTSANVGTSFGTVNQSIFNDVKITNVNITPINKTDTSSYTYQISIKPITQNYFNSLSIKQAIFSTKDYINDNVNLKEQCTNQLNVAFEYPTNITPDKVLINIEPERNFNGKGTSTNTYYNSKYDYFYYEFTTPDNYSERGYKLPYYTAKFKVATLLSSGDESYYVYLYPIWNPREYNTGIELTSLIDESEPIIEE